MRCFHLRHLHSLWRRITRGRSIELRINLPNGNITGSNEMNLTLASGASQDYAVVLADASGNVCPSSTDTTATSSNPAVATATMSADGSTLVVASVGAVGNTTVTVTLGALSATVDVEVAAGNPVSLTLVAEAAPAAAPVADAVAPVADAAPVATEPAAI